MGRARRARRIAATAAYGGGGLAAGIGTLGALGYGLLKAEAIIARRVVGQPFEGAPDDNGVYGSGSGDPVELVVLGDSSAAGMGCDTRYQTVGAIIANGVSALMGRPVRLTNTAVIGAESSGLELQLANALDRVPRPHVAVIMIGANDVTHRIDKSVAVRHLGDAVRRLRALGAEVIVGTCPDLGTIEPIPQPLRLIGRRWSRDMAAAQIVAVVEAGGRTVSLGDLLGPEFAERPQEMFSADRFHPSPAGYARAAAALLPSVYAALATRGCTAGFGMSLSVPTRPGARPRVPDAISSGPPVPWRTSAKASMAARSVRAASAICEKSWLYPRCTTPSARPAAARRLATSSSEPFTASAPSFRILAAASSLRARPSTWCPAEISSTTLAEPIQPEAPVTRIRMCVPLMSLSDIIVGL